MLTLKIQSMKTKRKILWEATKDHFEQSDFQFQIKHAIEESKTALFRILFNKEIIYLSRETIGYAAKQVIEHDNDEFFSLFLKVEPKALFYLLEQRVAAEQWDRIVTNMVSEDDLFRMIDGDNCLLRAARLGMAEHVKVLTDSTENAKNLNLQDSNGQTALMVAVAENKLSVVIWPFSKVNKPESLKKRDNNANNPAYCSPKWLLPSFFRGLGRIGKRN